MSSNYVIELNSQSENVISGETRNSITGGANVGYIYRAKEMNEKIKKKT